MIGFGSGNGNGSGSGSGSAGTGGRDMRGIRGLAIACTVATAATFVVVAPAEASEQVTPVASCDELAAALATSGTVLLTQEFTGPDAACEPLEVGPGADVVLDLDWHDLQVGDFYDPSPGDAAIFVPTDSRLTVRGRASGSLTVYAGDGAGIGARPGSGASGDIRIEGGSITATSRTAAGIGGADGDARVEITGGRVTARSSTNASVDSGAAIGGGRFGTGVVEVTGGLVRGESWSAAGIGGGSDGNGIVTMAEPEAPPDASRFNTGASVSGAGIGGGVRGVGEVVIAGRSRVLGFAGGASADENGPGIGDPSGIGTVTISGLPTVVAGSIRSSRTEILGGSVRIDSGYPRTDPRPVAGDQPLSPISIVVTHTGNIAPGPLLSVVDADGVPTGYQVHPSPLNEATLWLPPGPAWIRGELYGDLRTFPVTVAEDGSSTARLNFGSSEPPPPTLKERIATRFAQLARVLGDNDAAITRIARELGTTEGTVRYWLRRAGEIG
ncbi:hypothetical protein [Agromyces salentinus]|uniref:Helix-turn-helix domain-containing protein n=1 Tax=Agromyces salentinus TaxID=269421 RepID=A0ABP4Z0A2_9MICO|nr:hypothetical protein [Agromyces salentinus]